MLPIHDGINIILSVVDCIVVPEKSYVWKCNQLDRDPSGNRDNELFNCDEF